MNNNPLLRPVARSMVRGLIGRCPACGKGRLLNGYISPVTQCERCAEVLSPYQTADFAPYVVTFLVGLLYTPLVLVLALRERQDDTMIAIIVAFAVATALLLLPRVKGAVIGLLWALRVGNT